MPRSFFVVIEAILRVHKLWDMGLAMNRWLTDEARSVFSPLFLLGAASLLSLAWLLPNHTQPWTSFHADAWVSILLLLVCLWLFWRAPGRLELAATGVVVFGMAIVPWLQLSLGVIHSFGTAWITSVYLLGFGVAILAGRHWEKHSPGQCLDFLFLAISIAAVISVGIQLCQWLRLAPDNPWILESSSSRFAANIGQPNILASLLLLAIAGVAWGYARKHIATTVAIMVILYLLLGVALTGSRTAWINVLGLLAGFAWLWSRDKPRYFNFALFGFGTYFVFLHFAIPEINQFLFGAEIVNRELSDPIRLLFWSRFAGQILERPLFGYGWGQLAEAYLSMESPPAIAGVVTHSHNLILDVFLYCGVVIGSIFLLSVAAPMRRFIVRARSDHTAIPLAAVCILVVHSMLELPLHHAFFLLPFGMIFGVLCSRTGAKAFGASPKWLNVGGVLLLSVTLAVTVLDYFEVERTFHNIRYGKEKSGQRPEEMPALYVLTQWRDRLDFVNTPPEFPISLQKYDRMKGVVVTTPSPFLIYRFAQYLALNGSVADARYWLTAMCRASPENFKQYAGDRWLELSEADVRYAAIEWSGCPAK